jgi:hypothetical protein
MWRATLVESLRARSAAIRLEPSPERPVAFRGDDGAISLRSLPALC